jgi:hypothetical protein
MKARDLVGSGAKLEGVSPLALQSAYMVWIQRILDQGDHDSCDRVQLKLGILALRELERLRVALKLYGEHKAHCSFRQETVVFGKVIHQAVACDCGLAENL